MRNVVLIITDDLGMGDAAPYGHARNPTPNLCRLAAEGVRCTQFQTSGPVCSPTRAALYTGRQPQRCGIEGVVSAAHHRHTGMHRDTPTLMQMLGSAGIPTGLFGKWHLGYSPEFGPNHFGCETFCGFVSGNVDYQSHVDQAGCADWWRDQRLEPMSGYTTDLITREACRWIESHRGDRFCCIIPHAAPHYPYQGRGDAAERQPGVAPEEVHGRRARLDPSSVYDEIIAALDDSVGTILDHLEHLGLRDETLVVFTGDHGAPVPMGSNAPFRAGKGSLFQGGLLVPTFWSCPGFLPQGTCCQAVLSSLDVTPGILAALGLGIPPGLDGTNPLGALRGDAPPGNRTLWWRYRQQRALRHGDWKWVFAENRDHLFDLSADPTESDDRSSVEPDILKRLRTQWDRCAAEWSSCPLVA